LWKTRDNKDIHSIALKTKLLLKPSNAAGVMESIKEGNQQPDSSIEEGHFDDKIF